MIRIMTDSAADIPASLARELGIEILPFMIHFGDDSVCADMDLEPETFYDLLRQHDTIPSTSQMSPAELEDIYRKLGADGDPIIHVTISQKGSGIYNTSCLISNQLREEGFDITVVDSTTFSYVIGHPVVQAAKMAKAGANKEEILAYLTESYARDSAYFVVDDLTFLQKGGRIKATTMAISSILDIKPILSVRDGLVEAYQKVRGLKKAMGILANYAVERMENPEENQVFLLHSDAPDKIEVLKKMVEERVNPASIEVKNLGPIISSHAGLGLVGIYFKHKAPYESFDK